MDKLSIRSEQKTIPPDRDGNILKENALIVTARTAGGEIMGVRHRELPVEGVQFHPESVLTPEGDLLLDNFLRLRVEKETKT